MSCDNCPFISENCWLLCYVVQDIEVKVIEDFET